MSERMRSEEAILNDVNVKLGEPIGVGEGAIHTDMSAEEAQALAELLPKYLVEVDESASGSCIDGRGCTECLDGHATEARYSVAGGPLIQAYAMAELTGWFGDNAPAELEPRLTTLKDVLELQGIKLGAHIDEVALAAKFINETTGAAKTGCGADDKAPEAAAFSAAIAALAAAGDETATALFQAFMDESFGARKVGEIESQEKVTEAFRDWNPRTALDVVADNEPHGVEILEADLTPAHGHAEALAVIVKVPGRTINQKALLRDTGKQIFVIDVPYIDKIAKAMATGPRATEQYETLRHAGVAYNLGTYVALCDGSQRPAIIEAV